MKAMPGTYTKLSGILKCRVTLLLVLLTQWGEGPLWPFSVTRVLCLTDGDNVSTQGAFLAMVGNRMSKGRRAGAPRLTTLMHWNSAYRPHFSIPSVTMSNTSFSIMAKYAAYIRLNRSLAKTTAQITPMDGSSLHSTSSLPHPSS